MEKSDGHLLIVDDDEAARFTLSWVFLTEPWDVTTACSGRQAMDLIERQEFQLIILDYRMSETNGIELARRLRQYCSAPIVLCSAHLTDHRQREAEAESSIDCVLEKPVAPDVLRSIVTALADSGNTQGEAGKLQN